MTYSSDCETETLSKPQRTSLNDAMTEELQGHSFVS